MSLPALDALRAQCLKSDGPAVLEAAALSAEEAGRLAADLAAHDVQVRVLDGAALNGKADVLRALAHAFAFPGHFGHNWDAALDVLSDLSWLPARGWVCVLLGADALRAAHPQVHDALLETFRAAAERWQGDGGGAILRLVRVARPA